jgi:multiple antibiotic resistance protein
MMLEYSEYIKMLVGLVAVVNPIGAIPIFLTLSYSLGKKDQLRLVNVIAFSVVTILLVSLVSGELILNFFGITISSFKVGGGILILLMAIAMMHARPSGATQTEEEINEGESKESAAVVPLSIPLLAGPGAISTVILYGQKSSGIAHYGLIATTIMLLGAALWAAFVTSPWISKRLGKSGMNIITRIMGLILAAIAIEFISHGLKGIFPGLA